MAWCFEDEPDAYAERVFDHLVDAPAVVPGHFRLEVANAMLVALRRGPIDRAQAEAFLARIAQLPLELLARSLEIRTSFDLGHRYKLSSYDAAYLDLAMVEAIPLATNELDLRRAARRAHVAILNP
jgi:predicted nucleic acid-binding protein